MASALFKLSSDGGSTYLAAGTALADDEALAYNASGTYSIKAALDSTAGVDTVQWSITSADDVNIASLPAVTSNSDKTCTFSVTKTGGAWLLRCIVNGGVNALTGKTDPALVRALAVKVLNSAGQQEVAVGESNEAGPYGWTKAHNNVARTAGVGGGGPPSGSAGGDLGGTYPNPSVRRVAHVIYRQGVASPAPGQYATWAAALAAAQALPGVVTIYVDDQDDPPAIPTGTHDLQRRIRLVSWLGFTERVIVSVSSGAVLQDASLIEGLSFALAVNTPVFTSTNDGLDLELRNVYLGETEIPGSSGPLHLDYTYSKLLLTGGTVVQGGTNGLGTLPSGKTLAIELVDTSVDDNLLKGGAGDLYATIHAGVAFPPLSAFTGTIAGGSDHLRIVLANEIGDNYNLGAHKLTNVADPTSAQDAATKAYVDSMSGGGPIDEADLRTAAAALTASLDVNAVEITNLGNPTTDSSATHRGYVLGQATDLIYDEGGTAGNRVYTSLASAVTAAGSIPGRVRIWIRTTSGTPTTTGVTYALANRIELCGLLSTQRTTLAMVASAVFQDACAFRNLDIETDLAAAWLTGTSAISVAFDNTQIVDNGGTAAVATLPGGSTNFFTFDNGAAFNNGGTMPLCTLVAGKTVFLEVRDGQVSDSAITGTAGNLYVYEGGSGNYTVQSGFSGSVVAYQQKVISQLGRAATAVSVNSQRITNVAVPTASTDAAPRGWVDGSASVALGSTSVSLTAANVATGHVTLTGALSGNTTATLPTGARSVWLTNATTGTYALRIAGFSGGFCYLLPGQTKRLIQGADNVIRGEGLKVVLYDEERDLETLAVGTHDIALFDIPDGTTFTACEMITTEAAGTGSVTISLGTTGSMDDLLVTTALGSAGTALGTAAADAGSAWTNNISAYFRTGGTMTLRAVVTTATLTAGKVRVQIIGRYLGE